jgi:hypothetical protein
LAYSLAHESEKGPASTPPPAGPLDADLERLIAAWPRLSATARRMILAAVEADGKGK